MIPFITLLKSLNLNELKRIKTIPFNYIRSDQISSSSTSSISESSNSSPKIIYSDDFFMNIKINLHYYAPTCPKHFQSRCSLYNVKKNTNGNYGRFFYSCSQCNYFLWIEVFSFSFILYF